jgi:TRAP-type C4-dicarboxylate transport system substrate-binding protein
LNEVAPTGRTYKWKISECTAEETAAQCVYTEKFIEELKTLSDGRITVDFYPGNLLWEWDWQMEQVGMGTIDIACNPVPTAMDKRLGIASVYYMASDRYSAYEASDLVVG